MSTKPANQNHVFKHKLDPFKFYEFQQRVQASTDQPNTTQQLVWLGSVQNFQNNDAQIGYPTKIKNKSQNKVETT